MLVMATTNTGCTALTELASSDEKLGEQLGAFLGKLLLNIALGNSGVAHSPIATARLKMIVRVEWCQRRLEVTLLLPIGRSAGSDIIRRAVMSVLTGRLQDYSTEPEDADPDEVHTTHLVVIGEPTQALVTAMIDQRAVAPATVETAVPAQPTAALTIPGQALGWQARHALA